MSSRTVVIVQSNYLPWKGYFDLISRADVCVLYDEVQYTRRDWRNRNRIKTAQGLQWLTIPVKVRSRYLQRIRETEVADPDWAQRHWASLKHAYGRAPFFADQTRWLRPLYERSAEQPRLSEINRDFLRALCDQLGIDTPLRWSWEFEGGEGERSARLLSICQALGATRYLSGPAARGYLDEALFRRSGVEVAWMDYSGYPEYPQLHGDFVHEVSLVDLLFCTGPEARRFVVGNPG